MGRHDDALANLHKKHAEVQDIVNDMHGQLVVKDEEVRQRTHQISMQQQHMEQLKREWASDSQSLRHDIETYVALIRDKDDQILETRRQLGAANHENTISQETLREREAFITSVLSEKEISFKFQLQEMFDADGRGKVCGRQEKLTIDQLEQVRMTSKYLDSYASDITKAIGELTREVRSIEEGQGTCEAMMLMLSSSKVQPDCVSTSSQKSLIQLLCDQVGALQCQTVDLGNKLQTSESHHQKLNDDIHTLQIRIHHMAGKLQEQQNLVAKYQESSLCGTQTIDAMQLSISTLVSQHDTERHAMQHQIEEMSIASLKAEECNQSEAEACRANLVDMENDLADKTARIGYLESRIRELEVAAAAELGCRQSNHRIANESPMSTSMPTSTPLPPVAPPSQAIASAPSKPSISPSNVIADEPPDAASLPMPHESVAAVVIPDVCLACREEPFGFMVRCQKCKQQFHAGCVRSKRQKTSRVGCYVFVCEPCEAT
ncbi:hypothetical protein AaE_013519 [Aphanomyces astaci]|uniref:Zinc finger PHD-type domain-containing protein n=1 Tax=Aphanomyces astaci TaxID=112090 RepID=A0A6A4Z3G8_APHAT|nr:hypothetical protein AaE_013519 [Aphanomyces astaci]